MNAISKLPRRSVAMLCLVAVVSMLLAQACSAVKHEDFKTCEQSAFCNRHRTFADSMLKQSQPASPYSVIKNSVALDGHFLTAAVEHSSEKVPLKFELGFMKNGVLRVRVQEETPLKPRFDETQMLVLRDEGGSLPYASPESIKLASNTTDNGVVSHTISYLDSNSSFSIRMTERPWSLEYL
ncbi:glucosidase II, partial [Coemansia erecta]